MFKLNLQSHDSSNRSSRRKSHSVSSQISSVAIPSPMNKNDKHQFEEKFNQLNGQRKSRSELRHEFVSSQVMNQLKEASKQLENEKDKKSKKSSESCIIVKRVTAQSNNQDKVPIKHKNIKITTLGTVDVDEQEQSNEETKNSAEDKSKQVSIEDSQIDEVISSNADVQKTANSIEITQDEIENQQATYDV